MIALPDDLIPTKVCSAKELLETIRLIASRFPNAHYYPKSTYCSYVAGDVVDGPDKPCGCIIGLALQMVSDDPHRTRNELYAIEIWITNQFSNPGNNLRANQIVPHFLYPEPTPEEISLINHIQSYQDDDFQWRDSVEAGYDAMDLPRPTFEVISHR